MDVKLWNCPPTESRSGRRQFAGARCAGQIVMRTTGASAGLARMRLHEMGSLMQAQRAFLLLAVAAFAAVSCGAVLASEKS
jgi:hypothetical protein